MPAQIEHFFPQSCSYPSQSLCKKYSTSAAPFFATADEPLLGRIKYFWVAGFSEARAGLSYIKTLCQVYTSIQSEYFDTINSQAPLACGSCALPSVLLITVLTI